MSELKLKLETEAWLQNMELEYWQDLEGRKFGAGLGCSRLMLKTELGGVLLSR